MIANSQACLLERFKKTKHKIKINSLWDKNLAIDRGRF